MLSGPLGKVLAPSPPSLKRLLAEKFEGAEEWFTQEFLPPFNSFASDVVASLSRTLAEEREITFTTGVSISEGTAPFPLFIKPQLVSNVRRVTISNPCIEDSLLPTGAAQPQWRLASDGSVELRMITGLSVSSTYKMRLLLEP